jgi:hypothetical protein
MLATLLFIMVVVMAEKDNEGWIGLISADRVKINDNWFQQIKVGGLGGLFQGGRHEAQAPSHLVKNYKQT